MKYTTNIETKTQHSRSQNIEHIDLYGYTKLVSESGMVHKSRFFTRAPSATLSSSRGLHFTEDSFQFKKFTHTSLG
ncbi:hypothetical protein DVH24_010019 [Malus domestica]|uniref:Uncharacterized protein n=1 Tax=Malus domestica TaxID=3750 RepID=A0A498JV56_MALDO|nr:hypothetical protein DVH24_010019 [Malus domestica]